MEGTQNHDTELNTLINTLDKGFHDIIKKTLSPYVKKMQHSNEQINSITSILKQLPEFQKLIEDNAELRMENDKLKKIVEEHEKDDKVFLNVIDTKSGVHNTEEHVENIYDEFGVSNRLEKDLVNTNTQFKNMCEKYSVPTLTDEEEYEEEDDVEEDVEEAEEEEEDEEEDEEEEEE
jgi:regulator of replication initiation timing